jgi:FkbM family methyltransferase
MNIKEKLKRYYRYAFKDVPKTRIDRKYPMERHGGTYGGWNIIQDSLESTSTVYSFGIGKDISFDRSIHKKYGCKIFGFDPTPEVKNWLGQFDDLDFFEHQPVALGAKDGTESFYFPENENNISMTTLKNELGSSKNIEVEMARLSTLMNKLGHRKIDLLKMDIEGSEYEVIPDILSQNLDVSQILVEMHHFFDSFSGQDSDDLIQKMRSANYELISISDSLCEFSFKKTV